MKGNCETCAKQDTCKKDAGIIFGMCKTDYEPKRKYIPISEAIAWRKEFYGISEECGICAAVVVTNMGYCKDSITRWYQFDMDGTPCYTLKF